MNDSTIRLIETTRMTPIRRSVLAVARPASSSRAINSAVKPCARYRCSLQPFGLSTSRSRARWRSRVRARFFGEGMAAIGCGYESYVRDRRRTRTRWHGHGKTPLLLRLDRDNTHNKEGRWLKNSGSAGLSSARLRPLRALVEAMDDWRAGNGPQAFFMSAATNPYHIFPSPP